MILKTKIKIKLIKLIFDVNNRLKWIWSKKKIQRKKFGSGALREVYIAKGNTSEQEITVKIDDNQVQKRIAH